MIPYADRLAELASFIGSMTVVGGALLWMYQKFIGGPRERRKKYEEEKRAHEERQRYRKMLELVAKENEPLVNAIDNLTEWLEESTEDRRQLNDLTKQHNELISKNVELIAYNDRRLDTHHERILELEIRSGLRKYREEGKDEKLDINKPSV